MKRRQLVGSILAALSLTAAVNAQQELPPGVRKPFRLEENDSPAPRAVPVEKPAPRAVPVERPLATPAAPASTPVPKPKVVPPGPATPKPVANATPPKATPAPLPEPEDPGTIRVSPSQTPKTADIQQLEIADGYYGRKMYDMAAPEYEKYLGLYPNGADRATALFRLGESYRRNGSLNAAKTSYESLLTSFRDSEFIGAASYRLAELYYAEKQYRSALPLYRRASVRLKDPAVVNSAKFFTARSLEATLQKTDARAAYEELVNTIEQNPFQDASRLSLALLLKEAGRTAEALKHIQALEKQTENPDLKAQATVRAGLWLLDLQQSAKAEVELKRALELPSIGPWKDVAQLGLLRMYYETNKYQQVIDFYDSSAQDFTPESRPELYTLVANSYRQLGKHAEAQAVYERILKDFPTSGFGKEAQYERLKSLYYSESPELVAEIDKYLVTNPDPEKRDQVLLMKAEVLFKKQDYAAAAPIYATLDTSRQLTGTLKAEAVFKLGWCYMQTRDVDRAIKAFTTFIQEYPTNKSLPYALVQRALAHQQQKNFTAALKDYSELITRFKTAKERELALEQKALILGQQSDNQAMAETFELLLKDYPETTARPKANYWVGRVAFDAKNYKKAATYLGEARKLDKEQFFERASLLILLSHYYLEDKAAAAAEVDAYAKEGKTKVPPEVLRWLAKSSYESKENDFENAEKYFRMLTAREEATPEDFLFLGQSQLELSKYKEAVDSLQTYLKSVKDPEPRATGLLEVVRAQIGLGAFDAAQKSVDEALTLQPEGKLNGEGRIAAGDVQMARESYEQAAKLYSSVSLLLDDEEVTPKALEKAYNAFKKAGMEPEAKKTLNTLQSRYPEYLQRAKDA